MSLTYSREDLSFAASAVLMSIQAVYTKLADDPTNPPIYPEGFNHCADIIGNDHWHVDDSSAQNLLDAIYAQGTLMGGIDVDSANKIGIVSFRGDESDLDWIRSFEAAPVHFEEVAERPLVHFGFYTIYKSVRQSLMDNLHFLDGLNRVVIGGHSMGAAVAVLCLLELASRADGADTMG